MTDDLEAQARKFVTKSWPYKGTTDVKVRAALTWARRLVAESRAGALADAVAVLKYASCTCARQIESLAAEAVPGAKDG